MLLGLVLRHESCFQGRGVVEKGQLHKTDRDMPRLHQEPVYPTLGIQCRHKKGELYGRKRSI